MDIKKIDKNFQVHNIGSLQDKKVYTLPHKDIPLYGLYGEEYDEQRELFCRLPYNLSKSVSESVLALSNVPCGVRVKFSTNSTQVTLSVGYECVIYTSRMPLTATSGFVLLEETGQGTEYIGTAVPNMEDERGYERIFALSGDKMRNYILYFPLVNHTLSRVSLGFDKDCIVQRGRPYRYKQPIVYYGSSITQGMCASRSDNIYQAYVSKWNDIDFLNFGLAGNCKAEERLVEYISKIPAEVFVCDYDYNTPSLEYLQQTHYRAYAIYRKEQPNTPILFLSKPDFENNPTYSRQRLEVVRSTYKKALKSGDKNVYFIDGRTLFGKADRENCTVDGCHPNDLGFYRMAQKIDKMIKKILSKKKDERDI